jgi:hypothetical protein
MYVRQMSDRNWYVCRRSPGVSRTGRIKKSYGPGRLWFFVKAHSKSSGLLVFSNLVFPERFVGKKVMIQVIELDDQGKTIPKGNTLPNKVYSKQQERNLYFNPKKCSIPRNHWFYKIFKSQKLNGGETNGANES